MTYLFLSIASSAMIFIIFKWIGRLGLKPFPVIVLNYLTAGLVGWMLEGSGLISSSLHKDWFIPAVVLGAMFPAMFYLMAVTTHRVGAASTSVANKMSVVIPVTIAFFLYGDTLNMLKISGILIALAGIVLASRKTGSGDMTKGVFLIAVIFTGSGLIDAALKFMENFYLSETDIDAYTSILFLSAFSSGFVVLMFRIKATVETFTLKSLGTGLLLGTVNFGSVYFLILTLRNSGFDSSSVFPLNNIGVVLLSAFLSNLLFGEKLSRINLIGIGLSVLALVFLMLSNQ